MKTQLIRGIGRLHNPLAPPGYQYQAVEMTFELPSKPRRRKRKKKC